MSRMGRGDLSTEEEKGKGIQCIYPDFGENAFLLESARDEGLELHHFSSVLVHLSLSLCVRQSLPLQLAERREGFSVFHPLSAKKVTKREDDDGSLVKPLAQETPTKCVSTKCVAEHLLHGGDQGVPVHKALSMVIYLFIYFGASFPFYFEDFTLKNSQII